MLNLQALRKKSGISHLQLAAITGVKPSDIALWENGLSFPPLAKLFRLCEVLNTDLRQLLTGSPLLKYSPHEVCIPVFDLVTSGMLEVDTTFAAGKLYPWCFAITLKTHKLAPRVKGGDMAFFCPPSEMCGKDIVLFFDDEESLDIDFFYNVSSKKIVAKMCELRSRL